MPTCRFSSGDLFLSLFPAAGAYRRYPLSAYLKKKVKRIDALIVDELHQYSGESAQGQAMAELAGIVGMDAETLENTVKTYNTFVQNGKDEEFGRAAEYLTKEIGEGPYYLVEQKPRFATTMGGLVVTTNLEVKNTSDTVIPGLYAAGETVGGVMGDDSPSGANNGWALTSGKLAAEAIAEALK